MAAVLARALGDGVGVESVTRLSGGASRETWRIDAVDGDSAPRAMVLRREPPGGSRLGPDVDEFLLTSLATRAGVPTAAPVVELRPSDDLGTGFVMELVEGETIGRRVLHERGLAGARARLTADCADALAAVHSIDIAASGLRALDGRHAAELQLDEMTQLIDGFDATRPVLELALRRLRDHLPRPRPDVVVHGDFRVGNLVVGPDGLRAVLDWELAHVGSPAEDLGWLCVRSWRFGGRGRVGGFGAAEDLLAAYRAAGGADDIDLAELTWWETYGNLRWAAICMVQAWTHLSGARRSVELAAIGRRVCEVEHDLMELLA